MRRPTGVMSNTGPLGWRKGPLPPDTWNWGAVIPVGMDAEGGFFFADFRGNVVVAFMATASAGQDRTLQPEDVAWFNNDIQLPPDK